MAEVAFCFGAMSIKKLKEVAGKHGVDIRGCYEKAEIVAALRLSGLRDHQAERPARAQESPATPPKPAGDAYDVLSISQLKRVAKERRVDIANCLEKDDLVRTLRRHAEPEARNLCSPTQASPPPASDEDPARRGPPRTSSPPRTSPPPRASTPPPSSTPPPASTSPPPAASTPPRVSTPPRTSTPPSTSKPPRASTLPPRSSSTPPPVSKPLPPLSTPPGSGHSDFQTPDDRPTPDDREPLPDDAAAPKERHVRFAPTREGTLPKPTPPWQADAQHASPDGPPHRPRPPKSSCELPPLVHATG
ncbi:hypothetical protein M885DRAFT_268329 [Pelagophyceae sp. CCMP2097]|nr:hypothetical protein M885DRAFT_268329 [Pelagophyceae sp. CCMP2097]